PEIRAIIGNPSSPTLVATTYLSPFYCTGSFYKTDFWNQRRGLIGYWGDREKPGYFQLKCLHDGYDYSSGLFHSVHLKNGILGIINFATDYGDTHISLDKVRDATIKAEDLRLRLEFGGYTGDTNLSKYSKLKDTFIIQRDGVTVALRILSASFGRYPLRLEIGEDERNKWCDLVFYSGEETSICFRELEKALAVIAIYISEDEISDIINKLLDIEVFNDEKFVTAKWKLDNNLLEIRADAKPDSVDRLLKDSKGFINGLPVEEGVD
ncbi:MAG TPA: hypothetical protein PK487_06615, partial [bacterium]|nr:hypothetical protein [bacterium]